MELFLLTVLAVSVVGLINPAVILKLSFNPYRIRKHREYWRLFTYPFVHNGVLHLAFNLTGIWYVLNEVSDSYSAFVWCSVVGGSVVFSVIPTYLMRVTDKDYKLVGASGIMAALFSGYVLGADSQKPFVCMVMCCWIIREGVLLLRQSIRYWKGQDNYTAHEVHLAGWLYGCLVTSAVLFW